MTPERHKYLMKSVLGVDIDVIATKAMAEHNLGKAVGTSIITAMALDKTMRAWTGKFPELDFKRGNIVICNVGR